MTTERRPVITDDLPAEYVRFLYGRRIDRETVVFSRSDALRQAEQERRSDAKHRAAQRVRVVSKGDL